MAELLRAVFLSDRFMPHGHCFLWKPGLVWLHAGSDAIIGTAYLVISLTLWQLVRRIRLPFSLMILSFGLFIGVCGLTHYLDVLTLWVPDYWLSGAVKAATAGVSAAAGVYLFQARSAIVGVAQGTALAEDRRRQLETAHRGLEVADRRHQRSLRALRECSKALVRATDEQGLLDGACRIVVEVCGHRMSWVGLAEDNESKAVRPASHAGEEEGWLSAAVVDWGDAEPGRGPVAAAIRSGRPTIARDGPGGGRPFQWPAELSRRGHASVAAVPLVADGATLGALVAHGSEADAFGDDEMRLLADLADHLAFGISALRGRAEHARMTAQLMQADRLASMGTLAAGVAHEINNPLAYVMGGHEFLSQEMPSLSPQARADRLDEIGEVLQEMRGGLERIRQVVLDLRIFSRRDERASGPVEIRQILESSINMAFNEIRHRARLVKDFGPVPSVEASESRVGQVFLNLLINAAQAIPEGAADRNEIRVVTRTDGAGCAVIEVRDTGSGIPPAHLARIFEPYFTTKPVGVGTGLGLSICRNIVDGMGGEIAVESQVGNGTVFRVSLPPAPPGDGETPAEPVSTEGRRGRVLVVDDEPLVGSAIRRALGQEHDVVLLTSAREAQERIARGERFDAILADLMMPEMTGMDLHAALTALAPDQARRMVLLTGGAFTETASRFLDAVSNARVPKPFDTANLRAVVRSLVG